MDPKEKFVQDFVAQGRAKGFTDEEIKKRLEPALMELDQRLQSQAQPQAPVEPQGDGILKEIGQELIRPWQQGSKTASMVGNSIQTFLTPEYHSLQKRAESGDILSDAEISKLNEYANSFAGRPVGMGPDSNFSKNWFEFSDEDMNKKFSGDTTGERLKNTAEHSLKTSAGIGSYFVPLGPASKLLPGGTKAVTTIAKTPLERATSGAIARILKVGGLNTASGLLNEASKEDITAKGMATAGLASFIFGSGTRGLGEVTNKVGEGLTTGVPRLFMRGYAKPPTSKLQMKETEEALKYGKKMLSEQIIENGDLTRSPTKLWKHSSPKLEEVGEKITEVVDASKEELGLDDIYRNLDDAVLGIDELVRSLPEAQKNAIVNITGGDAAKVLESVKKDLAAFAKDGMVKEMIPEVKVVNGVSKPTGRMIPTGKMIPGKIIEPKYGNLVRKQLDKTLNKAYDLAKKGADLTPEDSLKMDLADVLRDSLNTNVKGLAPLNQQYSYYKGVQRATLPIISKGMHSAILGDSLIVGMGTAGAIGGSPLGMAGAMAGAAGGTLVGSGMAKVMRSPTTWFTAALFANKAGKATTKTATKTMDSKLLEFLGRRVVNTATGAQ